MLLFLRAIEDLSRRAHLNQGALVKERHAVRDLAGEAHLVGDAEHGHARGCQLTHGVQHLLDHLRIERRGRFIEQHDLRLHGERAGDGHPLLLAA